MKQRNFLVSTSFDVRVGHFKHKFRKLLNNNMIKTIFEILKQLNESQNNTHDTYIDAMEKKFLEFKKV